MKPSPEDLQRLDSLAVDYAARLMEGETPEGASNRWAHRTLGVVLAGGQSRRMNGIDKPLLEIAGETLLSRVVSRLSPQVGGIVISGNDDLSRFGTAHPVLADGISGHLGPLAGILAAMRWAEVNAAHVLWVISTAADTPFFPHDLVDRLIMAMGGPGPAITLAQSGDQIHPTFALWPVALADDIERYLNAGDRKLRAFAAQHINSCAVFQGMMIDGLEIDPFFNLNSPDDIEVAEAIAAGLAEQSA
ncbi:molybdopterin-guanine dinucleotide biosynthesis protein A [Cohaesibacter sp. ES.047]|uniref:molybdenum cofactor guanylyltransferase MobA n=1 Tax=Cohaesibacter sp. ES.047 TaxID=1798205 RepID=UPI000BBF953F|nr:molybdenum cofactor guanylyltransferase MobA [Cohaesibacter sp. ES.047]SNY93025.1 molybdopterin-guanine dinucleotide biosynthesis protein A [Cohaesibacter sp. ES.047]